MSETIKAQKEQLAALAIERPELFEGLLERMAGSSRRNRQNAASVLAIVAAKEPNMVMPHLQLFIDALEKPEAQTKWESIDALTALLPAGLEVSDSLLDSIEDALFDEDSGSLRLAAMRFVCAYGAMGESAAKGCWPLIDEALQCYHGDSEFQDMLLAVTAFSESDLPEDVANALRERMAFDAQRARGALKKRAQMILDNLN